MLLFTVSSIQAISFKYFPCNLFPARTCIPIRMLRVNVYCLALAVSLAFRILAHITYCVDLSLNVKIYYDRPSTSTKLTLYKPLWLIIYESCTLVNFSRYVVDILQALKEEEEMLLQKRQIYLEEMNENEHLQKQMEICGQGLEMRLRDQGSLKFRVQLSTYLFVPNSQRFFIYIQFKIILMSAHIMLTFINSFFVTRGQVNLDPLAHTYEYIIVNSL